MIWLPANSLEQPLNGESRRGNALSQDIPMTGSKVIEGICPKSLAPGHVAEAEFLITLSFRQKE